MVVVRRRVGGPPDDRHTRTVTRRFDEGIAHLHRYVAVHGTSNPRQRDVIDEFPIGRWVNTRRTDSRRGVMLAYDIEMTCPDIEMTCPDIPPRCRRRVDPGPAAQHRCGRLRSSIVSVVGTMIVMIQTLPRSTR